jgi:tetratricopeptide (TPR) repeat protein
MTPSFEHNDHTALQRTIDHFILPCHFQRPDYYLRTLFFFIKALQLGQPPIAAIEACSKASLDKKPWNQHKCTIGYLRCFRSRLLLSWLVLFSSSSADTTTACINQGNTLFRQKRYEEALEQYKLASASGGTAKGYLCLARTYEKLDRLADAVEAVNRGLQLGPQNSNSNSTTEI